MAKGSLIVSRIYQLELSEEEVVYLRGLLQNPLHDTEPQIEQDLRADIFEELSMMLK